MKKKWIVSDCVEWTYEREEGDIVVFARTAKEAADTIRHHGFLVVDVSKIRQTGGSLANVLKKDEIQ